MAEYINKAEIISYLEENILWTKRSWEDMTSVIDELPTIDIVFCKDCKHRRGGNCFKEYPPGFNHKKDTDYCSKGERRTK